MIADPQGRARHPGREGARRRPTAINYDTQQASAHDRNLIIPIILLVILIVLGLVLRALVAPLLLILTVVLSFSAALGVSALVFNHVFHFANADPGFPLFAFVFLVALGIDYNIFLMTRVREETLQYGTRQGVLRGLAVTGGVITSAGFVLAATFAVLGVLPVVFLAEVGFAVAFGVLLDTIVVRSILVPALGLRDRQGHLVAVQAGQGRRPRLSRQCLLARSARPCGCCPDPAGPPGSGCHPGSGLLVHPWTGRSGGSEAGTPGVKVVNTRPEAACRGRSRPAGRADQTRSRGVTKSCSVAPPRRRSVHALSVQTTVTNAHVGSFSRTRARSLSSP